VNFSSPDPVTGILEILEEEHVIDAKNPSSTYVLLPRLQSPMPSLDLPQQTSSKSRRQFPNLEKNVKEPIPTPPVKTEHLPNHANVKVCSSFDSEKHVIKKSVVSPRRKRHRGNRKVR
jgi:hypothetical protein